MGDGYLVCDCCRLQTTQPGHRVQEFADRRRVLVFCKTCATHWSPKADGTVYVPVRCPANPRPELRIIHLMGADGSVPARPDTSYRSRRPALAAPPTGKAGRDRGR